MAAAAVDRIDLDSSSMATYLANFFRGNGVRDVGYLLREKLGRGGKDLCRIGEIFPDRFELG